MATRSSELRPLIPSSFRQPSPALSRIGNGAAAAVSFAGFSFSLYATYRAATSAHLNVLNLVLSLVADVSTAACVCQFCLKIVHSFRSRDVQSIAPANLSPSEDITAKTHQTALVRIHGLIQQALTPPPVEGDAAESLQPVLLDDSVDLLPLIEQGVVELINRGNEDARQIDELQEELGALSGQEASAAAESSAPSNNVDTSELRTRLAALQKKLAQPRRSSAASSAVPTPQPSPGKSNSAASAASSGSKRGVVFSNNSINGPVSPLRLNDSGV